MATEADYLAETLATLCREPRKAGSPRNAEIAAYLRSQFQSLGYATEVQEFRFVGWNLLTPPQVEYLAPVARAIPGCLPVVWSESTDGAISGEVRLHVPGVPATIKTYEAYEWNVFPVLGESGRVAAWLLSSDTVWPQPRDDERDPTPCVMIPPAEGGFIANTLRNGGPVRVRLSVGSEYVPDQVGRNIAAHDGPVPTVLVGAHFDSFFTTTGAHDNASGTAALLCLARRLAVRPPPGVGFVCFDAEEWNKLGSYRHVGHLEQSGTLKDVRLTINLDSVGVGEGIYLLNSPNLGPSPRQALQRIVGAASSGGRGIRPSGSGNDRSYLLRPLHISEEREFPQFDTWPFMKGGVPVLQIGTFGAQPFPHWHQPADQLSLLGANERQLIQDVVSLVADLLNSCTG